MFPISFCATGIITICEPCYWRYKEILLVPNQSKWHPLEFWKVPNHCRWSTIQKVKTIKFKTKKNIIILTTISGTNVFCVLQVWTSLPNWESREGYSRTPLMDFLLSLLALWRSLGKCICCSWAGSDGRGNGLRL